jgi:N-acetylneuraminic acid mutarotase
MVGHLPEALDHAAGVALGGRMYVLGGDAGGSPTDRIVQVLANGRTTTLRQTLPEPVADGAAATLGASAYLAGGRGAGSAPLDSIVRIALRPRR